MVTLSASRALGCCPAPSGSSLGGSFLFGIVSLDIVSGGEEQESDIVRHQPCVFTCLPWLNLICVAYQEIKMQSGTSVFNFQVYRDLLFVSHLKEELS